MLKRHKIELQIAPLLCFNLTNSVSLTVSWDPHTYPRIYGTLYIQMSFVSKIQRDADDIDLQKRQEAFHRLQWLKIEEKRLAEENRRLEGRLEDLKNQHKRENTQATMKTAIMEQKMHELEDEEIEKQEQYEAHFNAFE